MLVGGIVLKAAAGKIARLVIVLLDKPTPSSTEAVEGSDLDKPASGRAEKIGVVMKVKILTGVTCHSYPCFSCRGSRAATGASA